MYASATNLATVPALSASQRMTTTLYELVEALSTEVGPEDDHLVTAAVMHLINSGQARFVGSRKQITVVEA